MAVNKGVCIVTALSFMFVLSACQSKADRDKALMDRFNKQNPNDWVATSYNIDEIRAFSGKHNDFSNMGSTERSSKAIKCYNIILGYMENKLNLEYNVYDIRYDSKYKTYAIDFAILDQIKYNDSIDLDDNLDFQYVTIMCDEEQQLVRSNVEEYLMQYKWVDDIQNEFNNKFSDVITYSFDAETENIESVAGRYYLNANKLDLTDDMLKVMSTNFDYDNIDDYTLLLDNETYIEKGYSPRMRVNVFVPSGTSIETKDSIIETIAPTLKKYCVTDVYVICPTENCNLQLLWMEETKFNNNYYNSRFEEIGDIEWQMVYKFSLGKGADRVGWTSV